MSVILRSLNLRPYRLPLVRPWLTSQGTVDSREGFVVVLESANATGYGDCAPLPSHGTESLEDADEFFRRNGPKFATGAAQMFLARLHPLRRVSPAACFALETACLDILAQERGVPLSRYLGPRSPDSVAVSSAIGPLDDGAGERARAAFDEGFSVMKIKAGLAPAGEERDRLATLASSLPEGAKLRIDANGAWSHDEAAAIIEGLAGLPIDGLEEPCADADLESLAGLQARADFPLALDESVAKRGLETLIEAKAVRRLVLKPTVIGGLAYAAKLGREALREGLEVVVTTSLDSAVGVTAAAHLAAVLDGFDPESPNPAHGLATSSWFNGNVARPPEIEQGRMILPDRAGLGITVPADA